jgi:hypothetical protein
MGDGQHGWAAAEWVMMIRHMFIREEGDRLIIGSGLFAEWFETEEDLFFGPTLTPWGRVTVRISHPAIDPTILIDATWRDAPPAIDVAIPGFRKLANVDAAQPIPLERIRDGTESTQLESAFAQGSPS